MKYHEQILRSDLNQAIYDLNTWDNDTWENLDNISTEDKKTIEREKAYIKRKIKELEEIKAQDFLNKEQKDFLIKRGFKMKAQEQKTRKAICKECKKEFVFEVKWKFQLNPNWKPRLCKFCDDKESLGIMNKLIGKEDKK